MNRQRVLIVLTVMLCPLVAAGQTPEVPSLRVGTSEGNVRLDGLFDEAAWTGVESISAFTMIEPSEGDMPTAATTVRLLVRPTEIFIGVVCDDPEPGDIVTFTKQRDGSLRNEDNIKIVLDTFLDGRSGYVFQVNPGGARYDALINPGGDSENSNWDGIWMAATHRDAKGWSAEIWIPAQSLTFKKDLTSWHFNGQAPGATGS